MIVVDCSAMVDFVVGRKPDDRMAELLTRYEVHVPHLLDVEVLNALRGLHLAGKISTVTAEQGREEYFALNLQRHPIGPLANRVWRLRSNMTAYDASYAALAEALECPLVTRDAKLSGCGHRAEVVLLD